MFKEYYLNNNPKYRSIYNSVKNSTYNYDGGFWKYKLLNVIRKLSTCYYLLFPSLSNTSYRWQNSYFGTKEGIMAKSVKPK